jgi:hypothetical protein
MELEASKHWERKRKYRKDITDDLIEYAIMNSSELSDKFWPDALNAICRIPPSGRILKVVYKKIGRKKIKIITTYWLD